MNAGVATRTRRSGRAQLRARRRRSFALLAVAAFAALAVVSYGTRVDDAVQEIALPLRHEDIIRQQARDKRLDPSLIAAVIYAESRFRVTARSPVGAMGLMQVTPDTARDIARRSGGTRFEVADLEVPQINISYGAYHLRYLLDRYSGNELLALAAYNGGEGNVDRWLQRAREDDRSLRTRDIPFSETRAYVVKVLDARRQYRSSYARELGL